MVLFYAENAVNVKIAMDTLSTQAPSTIQEVQKSQTLRLWDIFVLAPVMVYASGQVREKWLQAFLVLAGIGIVVFDGRNYLANRGSQQ